MNTKLGSGPQEGHISRDLRFTFHWLGGKATVGVFTSILIQKTSFPHLRYSPGPHVHFLFSPWQIKHKCLRWKSPRNLVFFLPQCLKEHKNFFLLPKTFVSFSPTVKAGNIGWDTLFFWKCDTGIRISVGKLLCLVGSRLSMGQRVCWSPCLRGCLWRVEGTNPLEPCLWVGQAHKHEQGWWRSLIVNNTTKKWQ